MQLIRYKQCDLSCQKQVNDVTAFRLNGRVTQNLVNQHSHVSEIPRPKIQVCRRRAAGGLLRALRLDPRLAEDLLEPQKHQVVRAALTGSGLQ